MGNNVDYQIYSYNASNALNDFVIIRDHRVLGHDLENDREPTSSNNTYYMSPSGFTIIINTNGAILAMKTRAFDACPVDNTQIENGAMERHFKFDAEGMRLRPSQFCTSILSEQAF